MEHTPLTGAEIAQRREAIKITQAELAKRVGVTKFSIQNWESGRKAPHKIFQQPLRDALWPEQSASVRVPRKELEAIMADMFTGRSQIALMRLARLLGDLGIETPAGEWTES